MDNLNMAKVRIVFLLVFILGILVGNSMVAEGREYYILEPETVSFDSSRIINYRDGYIREFDTHMSKLSNSGQEEYWTYGAAFNIDINLLRVNQTRVWYWNNKVNMVSTDSQVRYVAWDYEVGFTLYPKRVKLFYHHKSEHWLEGKTEDRYPLLDEVVLRIIFLERD